MNVRIFDEGIKVELCGMAGGNGYRDMESIYQEFKARMAKDLALEVVDEADITEVSATYLTVDEDGQVESLTFDPGVDPCSWPTVLKIEVVSGVAVAYRSAPEGWLKVDQNIFNKL